MRKAVIREYHHQSPFQPYQLLMVNGEVYNVPQPDFLMLGPPPEEDEDEEEDEAVWVFRRSKPGVPWTEIRLATDFVSEIIPMREGSGTVA